MDLRRARRPHAARLFCLESRAPPYFVTAMESTEDDARVCSIACCVCRVVHSLKEYDLIVYNDDNEPTFAQILPKFDASQSKNVLFVQLLQCMVRPAMGSSSRCVHFSLGEPRHIDRSRVTCIVMHMIDPVKATQSLPKVIHEVALHVHKQSALQKEAGMTGQQLHSNIKVPALGTINIESYDGSVVAHKVEEGVMVASDHDATTIASGVVGDIDGIVGDESGVTIVGYNHEEEVVHFNPDNEDNEVFSGCRGIKSILSGMGYYAAIKGALYDDVEVRRGVRNGDDTGIEVRARVHAHALGGLLGDDRHLFEDYERNSRITIKVENMLCRLASLAFSVRVLVCESPTSGSLPSKVRSAGLGPNSPCIVLVAPASAREEYGAIWYTQGCTHAPITTVRWARAHASAEVAATDLVEFLTLDPSEQSADTLEELRDEIEQANEAAKFEDNETSPIWDALARDFLSDGVDVSAAAGGSAAATTTATATTAGREGGSAAATTTATATATATTATLPLVPPQHGRKQQKKPSHSLGGEHLASMHLSGKPSHAYETTDAASFLRMEAAHGNFRILFCPPRKKKGFTKEEQRKNCTEWNDTVRALEQVVVADGEAQRSTLPHTNKNSVCARCAQVKGGCEYVHLLVKNESTGLFSTLLEKAHTCTTIEDVIPVKMKRGRRLSTGNVTHLSDKQIDAALEHRTRLAGLSDAEIVGMKMSDGKIALAATFGRNAVNGVPDRTLQRALKRLRDTRLLTVADDVQFLPYVVQELTSNGSYASFSCSTKEFAKEVFLGNVEKEVEKAKKKTIAYNKKNPETQLGIADFLASEVVLPECLSMDGMMYSCWAYAPQHAVHMVKHDLLTPMCAIDGTHSTRAVLDGAGGTYLCAYGQDVNHTQVLMMVVHVLGNESGDTWKYFFWHLREAYGDCLMTQRWTIIADGMKGISKAFKAISPPPTDANIDAKKQLGPFLFRCTNHRGDNIQTKFTAEHKSLYLYVCNAATAEELRIRKEFYEHMPRGSEFKLYMEKFPDEEQYAIAHLLHFGKSTYGRTTEAACEVMNMANKVGRRMAPTTSLMHFAMQDAHRARVAQEEALQCHGAMAPRRSIHFYGTDNPRLCVPRRWQRDPSDDPPAAYKKCMLQKTKGRVPFTYTRVDSAAAGLSGVGRVAQGDVRVMHAAVTLSSKTTPPLRRKKRDCTERVDLSAKTCTCGWWAKTQSPCAHAAGWQDDRTRSIVPLLGPHETIEKWKRQWSGTPIAKPSSNSVFDWPPLPMLEPIGPSPAGAPRKHKRMSSVARDYVNKKRHKL